MLYVANVSYLNLFSSTSYLHLARSAVPGFKTQIVVKEIDVGNPEKKSQLLGSVTSVRINFHSIFIRYYFTLHNA